VGGFSFPKVDKIQGVSAKKISDFRFQILLLNLCRRMQEGFDLCAIPMMGLTNT
jgi:hypothetical protein